MNTKAKSIFQKSETGLHNSFWFGENIIKQF